MQENKTNGNAIYWLIGLMVIALLWLWSIDSKLNNIESMLEGHATDTDISLYEIQERLPTTPDEVEIDRMIDEALNQAQ